MRDEDELFQRLATMLSPQHTPPAMVAELAKQSFGLRTVDAELAALTADSQVEGTAAPVRRGAQADVPRMLTFETAGLLVELEIGGSGRRDRIIGELIPTGPATIEVRQPGSVDPLLVGADEDGRFVVEGVRPGPFSLTCLRLGSNPVTTEWTSLD
jgi:hypothetical protein